MKETFDFPWFNIFHTSYIFFCLTLMEGPGTEKN